MNLLSACLQECSKQERRCSQDKVTQTLISQPAGCLAENWDATESAGISVSHGSRGMLPKENGRKRNWESWDGGTGEFGKEKIIFSSIEQQLKNITGEQMHKKSS